MTHKIADAQLLQLSDFVACHLGLHFPKEQWHDLARRVYAAAQECACQRNLDRYIQGLLSSTLTQSEMDVLVSHLTVGETYFFREKRSLEIFEECIVPELIRARVGAGTPIRIWSAGCATGEEPYSVAIALGKLMAGLKNWSVEILATDVNTKSLQRASYGTYSDWSFRGTPQWVRDTYFVASEDGRYAIAPAVRKMVSFSQLNLMDDAYPPLSNRPNSLDVIFCRNVLMYFTPAGMKKAVRQFHHHLATDGWLIVSPTETSQELFSDFASVSFGDVTLYKKSIKRLLPTIAMPAFDERESGVQRPEWTAEVAEPTRNFSNVATPETPDNEACSESTAPLAVSYEQALVLYGQGRYEDVEQALVPLLSEGADHASAMLLLARTYANQGKLAAALRWCYDAISANKMAAPAHYLRATILQEQGSLSEAFLAFRQAVYVEPQFVLGHFSLGNLALKLGRHQESEKHFENVLLLLAQYEPEDIVPESEGLSAGRLREMIVLSNRPGTVATQAALPCIRLTQQIRNPEPCRR